MPKIPVPLSYPGATGALRKDLERLADETLRFAQSTDAMFDARPSVPAPAYAATSVQYGQLLRVDPQGGVVVVSPPATRDGRGNALSVPGGERFEVAVAGAGTVIIRPSSTTIDGLTEIVVSELGLVVVRFDGQAFHSTRAARAPARTIEWRGSVGTMSPTFVRYLTANDLDLRGGTARNHYTLREPGFAGVARELVLHRYGASAGLAMPSPGPSGACTGAGNFLYSLEVNGSVRATGSVGTGLAYRSVSLVASLASTDQVGVRVQTFSGATWGAVDSYHHAILRVN